MRIARRSDGEIFVADIATRDGIGSVIRVFKLTDEGDSDDSFGGDGIADVECGGIYFDQQLDIFFQGNGKILLPTTLVDPQQMAVARLKTDGAFDGIYGDNGIATFPLGLQGQLNKVTVLPSGKILAAGSTTVGASRDVLLGALQRRRISRHQLRRRRWVRHARNHRRPRFGFKPGGAIRRQDPCGRTIFLCDSPPPAPRTTRSAAVMGSPPSTPTI